MLKCESSTRAEACGELRSLYRLTAASVVSVRRDRLIIENLERDGRSKLKLVVRGDDLEKWAAALERAVAVFGTTVAVRRLALTLRLRQSAGF